MRSQASRSRSIREASCRCAARSARTILLGSVVAGIVLGYLSFARLPRKRSVPVRLLALIPVAAAISLALSAVVDAIALPLFLDPTGTILATALAGPGVGIAVGALTSAVNTLRNPTFWPFVVVQVIVALYAGFAARAALFRSLKTAVPAGLGLGVIASLTSTPISYFVFGCTTTGGIALTTALGKALGLPPLGACFFGSFVSDFGDKAVTFALVASVLHALPRRTAARFPLALRAIGAA